MRRPQANGLVLSAGTHEARSRVEWEGEHPAKQDVEQPSGKSDYAGR
jgi:hypothetical protein